MFDDFGIDVRKNFIYNYRRNRFIDKIKGFFYFSIFTRVNRNFININYSEYRIRKIKF